MSNYKRITQNTYDLMADELGRTYDDYFNACVKDEADKFLKFLPEETEILDAGCGVGTHLKYFIENGFAAVGVDISAKMVEICRTSGLEVTQEDLEKMNLDRKFGGVWAHTSLIHFPKEKIPTTVLNILRHLKVDGYLFIALREGQGEGYEAKGATDLQRWFSNFQLGEFQLLLPKNLELASERVTEFRGRRFINLIFKNN